MQVNVTNGTLTQIQETLSPASGYELPSTISVTGATSVYNSTTGALTLTSIGSSVSITASGDSASPTPTETKNIWANTNQIAKAFWGSSKIKIYLGSTLVYGTSEEPEPQPVAEPYLTFSSPSSFTLNIIDNTKYWDGTLYYSTDTTNWSEWGGTTTLNSSSSGTTKYLYLRGSNNTIITDSSASSTKAKWVLTGTNISCIGNIENLLDYQTVANGNHPTMANYCYRNMFYGCTALTTPPSLPATTLADYCYYGMFQNCTSLTTAPSLPATTLANYCYRYMFYGCTNLTIAPSLPATTLADYCYYYMFQNCTSLTTTPSLPATTLAERCYQGMFYGCTSLTTAPSLLATTLFDYCYSYMFFNCSSLTTAPALPATTLAYNCYYNMFRACSSLTTPAIMASGTTQATSAKQCCGEMYFGCTALNIYTSSSGHTPFYKAITYSTKSSATNYRSSYQMFYYCKINGTQSETDYLTAGTQYYY